MSRLAKKSATISTMPVISAATVIQTIGERAAELFVGTPRLARRSASRRARRVVVDSGRSDLTRGPPDGQDALEA